MASRCCRLCIAALWLTLPLAVQVPAAGGVSTDTYAIDPHHDDRLCKACHVSEDTDELRTTDINALCGRCHDAEDHRTRIHPTKADTRGLTIPEGWPRTSEWLNCLTCHLPGHEEDLEIPRHLRGSPYFSVDSFCRRCHGQRRVAGNPHEVLNQGALCVPCHPQRAKPEAKGEEGVSLSGPVGVLCLACHDYSPHPANASHLLALTPERAPTIPPVYPLEEGRMTCVTCHNPHLRENDNYKLRGTIAGIGICPQCHSF